VECVFLESGGVTSAFQKILPIDVYEVLNDWRAICDAGTFTGCQMLSDYVRRFFTATA
jgi:hypothetical protein